MSPHTSRYVVELRSDRRPVGLYLHAWEDEAGGEAGTSWSRDVTRALRFADKRSADQHIRDELDVDAVASPLDAADLAEAPRDCGCTFGTVCRQNGNCPLAVSFDRPV